MTMTAGVQITSAPTDRILWHEIHEVSAWLEKKIYILKTELAPYRGIHLTEPLPRNDRKDTHAHTHTLIGGIYEVRG
jgi:hypothetical protein